MSISTARANAHHRGARRRGVSTAAGVLAVLAAAAIPSGCSISYQRHHATDVLRLAHNADHAPHGLDPAWAESAVRVLAAEMAVPLESVQPVDVYIDCDETSTRPSRFNRLTKSIVLRAGQASLSRLFVHELTHLLLDRIDGSPPYWVDQGLAQYMESRCARFRVAAFDDLLPLRLESRADEIRAMGDADAGDLRRHLERDAIDQGWSWSVVFIHYLLSVRWEDRSLPMKVRGLLELTDDDVDLLAGEFFAYCAAFDPIEEFVRAYRATPGTSARYVVLYDVNAHSLDDGRRILERLLGIETDPGLRELIAIEARRRMERQGQ